MLRTLTKHNSCESPWEHVTHNLTTAVHNLVGVLILVDIVLNNSRTQLCCYVLYKTICHLHCLLSDVQHLPFLQLSTSKLLSYVFIPTTITNIALLTAYTSDACVIWMLWLNVDACNLYKGENRMWWSWIVFVLPVHASSLCFMAFFYQYWACKPC